MLFECLEYPILRASLVDKLQHDISPEHILTARQSRLCSWSAEIPREHAALTPVLMAFNGASSRTMRAKGSGAAVVTDGACQAFEDISLDLGPILYNLTPRSNSHSLAVSQSSSISYGPGIPSPPKSSIVQGIWADLNEMTRGERQDAHVGDGGRQLPSNTFVYEVLH